MDDLAARLNADALWLQRCRTFPLVVENCRKAGIRIEADARRIAALEAELKAETRALDQCRGLLQQYVDAATSLRDKLEKARVDVGRYRYVRTKPAMLLHLSNTEFDAAIDAALAKEPK